MPRQLLTCTRVYMYIDVCLMQLPLVESSHMAAQCMEIFLLRESASYKKKYLYPSFGAGVGPETEREWHAWETYTYMIEFECTHI